MASVSDSWTTYYKSLGNANNFYPENFVTRVFLSKSPVQLLDGNYNNKRVLDLGCGYGRNIPFLLNNGLEVTGIDIADDLINRLKKQFPEQKFDKGTAENLPYSSGYFDYVLACNSLYYMKNKDGDFSTHVNESLRVLKDEGYFVFSMLGVNHSILNNSERDNSYLYCISNDFMGVRNGVYVQAFHPTIKKELFGKLKLLHHGEVLETLGETCRHIHYFVAQK